MSTVFHIKAVEILERHVMSLLTKLIDHAVPIRSYQTRKISRTLLIETRCREYIFRDN